MKKRITVAAFSVLLILVTVFCSACGKGAKLRIEYGESDSIELRSLDKGIRSAAAQMNAILVDVSGKDPCRITALVDGEEVLITIAYEDGSYNVSDDSDLPMSFTVE